MENVLRLVNANIVTPNETFIGSLDISGNIIQDINRGEVVYNRSCTDNIIDLEGDWVLPGFIDIHTHGAFGSDANTSSVEDLVKQSEFMAKHGVTSYLPTIMTDDIENIKSAIKRVVQASKQKYNGANIVGIHMEGPYLSHEYKGAMPESFLRKPNKDEFFELQEIAEGNIKNMTISPEVEGASEFIKDIAKTGVTLSLGHSGASYDRVKECIDKGITHATHTFNAMKMMHHREPAVVGAVFDSDITAEIILDGAHTHPAMIRILLKIKGYDNLVGITDSFMAAGLPDGKYQLGGNNVDVINGDAWLEENHSTRAGSTLLMSNAFKNFIKFTNSTVEQASKVLSTNPARVISIDDKKGKISVGYDADLVVINKNLDVKMTIIQGEILH